MVALPPQLFYNTQIPACLWFLSRNKTNSKFRNRSNEILFIDAREIGSMISRKQKELNDADILKITDTYHNWRNKEWKKKYKDVPGLCKSANVEEVRKNNYVLTGKSGQIDHLIPDQTDHPKLFPKSECFRGHFCDYKVG